jgi:hypothetical protein
VMPIKPARCVLRRCVDGEQRLVHTSPATALIRRLVHETSTKEWLHLAQAISLTDDCRDFSVLFGSSRQMHLLLG